MRRTDVLIIGGGQAGLAMSACLGARGIDHLVLERGRVAERWRSERWDSLRLLTPNWQSRLPGYRYRGPEPDGYMSMPEVITYFETYARKISAPVEEGTTVLSVELDSDGYLVKTDSGDFRAPNVVIATGHCDVPLVPEYAGRISGMVYQTTPTRYRNPRQLPEGGVLVVGAAASGVQLADELHRSGRQVTLAVGRHTRLPRCYRGEDISRWLDRMGVLSQTVDDVANLEASRGQPSLQLVGRPDRSTLDLSVLAAQGVRLVGSVTDSSGNQVSLADNLTQLVRAADIKLARLLDRIDVHAAETGRMGVLPTADRPRPFEAPSAPTSLDLRAEGIQSVVWATGFRRRYPWLKVPVLDERGELRHQGGVTPSPGLYAMGLRFMRRRNSSFIDGVGDDAEDLAELIAQEFTGPQRAAA